MSGELALVHSTNQVDCPPLADCSGVQLSLVPDSMQNDSEVVPTPLAEGDVIPGTENTVYFNPQSKFVGPQTPNERADEIRHHFNLDPQMRRAHERYYVRRRAIAVAAISST